MQSVKDTKFESNSQHVFVKIETNLHFGNRKSLDADRLIKLSDRDASHRLSAQPYRLFTPANAGVSYYIDL